MFCPECGKQTPDAAKFCAHCGYDLSSVTGSRQTPRGAPASQAQRATSGSASAVDLDGETVVGKRKLVLGNRYELREELGRGGMGIVYLAFDLELEMEIALKVLPPELSGDDKAVRQLKEEAKAAMQLSHPNIVRLHNFEETVEAKFLTMELIKGPSLAKVLSTEDTMSADEVVALADPICSGLSYAHSRGIIHRDIKPANIMVDADDTPKITDFGIARIVHDTMSRLTQATTAGTLVYMSPEQMSGQKIDRRTDIYALGSTFYELIAGHPPFYQGGIEYQIANVPPPPLENVPEHVNAAIMRALAKSPEDRFTAAEELAEALKRPAPVFVSPAKSASITAPERREPEPVPEPSVSEPPGHEPPPTKKRRPVLRVFLFLIVAVVAIPAYFFAAGVYEGIKISNLPPVTIDAATEGALEYPEDARDYRLDVDRQRRLEVVVEAIATGKTSRSENEGRPVAPPRVARMALVLGGAAGVRAQPVSDATDLAWVPRVEVRTMLSGAPLREMIGTGDPATAGIGMEFDEDTYVVRIASSERYGAFRMLVTEASPVLPLDGNVRGSLARSGETAMYSITVDEPASIVLMANVSGEGLDPELILTNAAGSPITRDDDGGYGLNSLITRDFEPGLYHATVRAVGSSLGDYVLHAARIAPIEIGAERAGTISDPYESCFYRLTMDGERDLKIAVRASGGSFDPLVSVVGLDSSFSRTDDDGGVGANAFLHTTVPAGDYNLMVQGTGASRTGSYVLSVLPGAPELGWEHPNTGDYRVSDWRYRFQVGGRTQYEFRVTGRDGLHPTLSIVDADGRTVASENAPGTDVRLTPTLDEGNYEVVIGSSRGEGPFVLTATEPTPSISLGSSRTGRITSAASRVSYRLALTEPKMVVLTLAKQAGSPDLDPKLYLNDARGRELDTDDDSGPDNNSLLTKYLAAGTYHVVAAAYSGVGAYRISAEEVPVSERISINSSTRSSVSPSNPLRVFELNVRTATTVRIAMNRIGTDIDPKLELYDAGGSRLAVDDDGGGDMNSLIERRLGAGRYFVLAYDLSQDDTGSFTLGVDEVRGAPPPGGPSGVASLVTVGDRKTGTLSRGGSVEYRFVLDSRTRVIITVDAPGGSGLDPKVVLRDRNNRVVAEDDDGGSGLNSRLETVLDRGVYLVRVEAVGTSSGAYQLEIGGR